MDESESAYDKFKRLVNADEPIDPETINALTLDDWIEITGEWHPTAWKLVAAMKRNFPNEEERKARGQEIAYNLSQVLGSDDFTRTLGEIMMMDEEPFNKVAEACGFHDGAARNAKLN